MILLKKTWRTILKYKAQFISMIIMIAIGVGVFLGFNIEWYSIEGNTNKFFSDSNYADFRLYSTSTGFTPEEAELVKEISGVDSLTRWLSVDVSLEGSKANLNLNAVEDYGISKFILVNGEDYNKNAEGVWLSDQFAKQNNIKLNDTIGLKYKGVTANLKVIGLIKSAEHMICVADENQLMPDYTVYGFCYVTPSVVKNNFGAEFYNQISIKSKLSKSELESGIKSALHKTTLLLSLDENAPYVSAKGEVEEGQTMGTILPVLFVLIAVLTMITTMHRVTRQEKIQIGTLKALGFKDKKILLHYTSFGFFIGLLGSLIGIILGYAIAAIVVSPTGMLSTYFDFPYWKLYMPWFCPVVMVLMVLFLTLIGFLTVKNMLKGMPAQTLKPYVPKKVKQTKLEKTKLWNKFSFGFKWNYRDTIRNKSRSLMTLIGVLGCVILIVASLGMRDSMSGFMYALETNMNYKSKINISESATISQIEDLKNEYNADWVSQVSIEYDKEAITLEIYEINNGYVKFEDKDSKEIFLNEEGAFICIRLADKGVKVGDYISFSPYGSENTYRLKVIGINRSTIAKNITISKKCADNLGLTYMPTALFTSVNKDNIDFTNSAISSVQEKKDLIDTYDSFLQIMNTMIFILVIAALGLGIVVLYNLGTMSYTERYREFATLKVVGYKDKQIAKLLIGQNIGLTIFGIILGLPLGFGVLNWMVKALASEYELKVTIGVLSCLITILLTFGVSLIVGLIISGKNKKIDMVEALKDKEA